jgi:hypothetical protein
LGGPGAPPTLAARIKVDIDIIKVDIDIDTVVRGLPPAVINVCV